jgi:hypothetical protein
MGAVKSQILMPRAIVVAGFQSCLPLPSGIITRHRAGEVSLDLDHSQLHADDSVERWRRILRRHPETRQMYALQEGALDDLVLYDATGGDPGHPAALENDQREIVPLPENLACLAPQLSKGEGLSRDRERALC